MDITTDVNKIKNKIFGNYFTIPEYSIEMRSTKTSKRVQSYANRAIQTSRKALLKDACDGMYNEYVRNNNKLPYAHVTNLVNELKQREGWITKNIVNKAFIQY